MASHHYEDEKLIAVENLETGMLVDLEGDCYADPKKDNPEYEFEFAVVDEVTRESSDTVLVEFRSSAVGFPLGHKVRVGGGL